MATFKYLNLIYKIQCEVFVTITDVTQQLRKIMEDSGLLSSISCYFKCMKKDRFGFTLIEMSIVLTVIALVVGGVIGGKAMIRNAEMRSVLNDAQKYMGAIQIFRDTYKAYPGDFTDATSLWGAMSSCPVGPIQTVPTSVSPSPTCNGNGDGALGDASPVTWNIWNYEMVLAWQHLSNAGLVPGHYTGTSASSVSDHAQLPGVNGPAASYQGGNFGLIDVTDLVAGDTGGGAVWYFPGNRGHLLVFGGIRDFEPDIPVLTTAEVFSVDSKIDDGKPGRGMVQVRTTDASNGGRAWPNCTLDADRYNLNYTGTDACGIIFRIGISGQ